MPATLEAYRRIERVTELASEHGLVPGPHSGDVTYVIDGKGRMWVRKSMLGVNCVLAEALGFLISRELCVPVPNGAVYISDVELDWLSEYIDSVMHWSSTSIQEISNPDELGGIIALDAIIGNSDRHAGNLLIRPGEEAGELHVISIDLADAWIGTAEDLEFNGVAIPSVRNLAPGIDVEVIRAGAIACAKRANTLGDASLRACVAAACEITNEQKYDRLLAALQYRCEHARDIVDRYLNAIADR